MRSLKNLKSLLKFGPEIPEDRLIDFSRTNFLEWNREREKHLQTIEHLKARVNELSAERDMWMRESLSNARRNT